MKRTGLFFVLLIFLAAGIFTALLFGGARIPAGAVLHSVLNPSEVGSVNTIIWKVRIPRILFGLLVGAGLAVSGCVFQGMLRNPLADPYTLGVSGGAALGASIGMMLGMGGLGIPLCAFTGALVSISLVYFVASRRDFTASTIILVGVIFSFLSSALVSLILSLSLPQKFQPTILWLMGDLSWAQPAMIIPLCVFIFAGTAVVIIFSREIDIITLGEEKAGYLGVSAKNANRILFVCCSLITGACVSVSGIIGFVGLMVPHFLRRFTGPGHRILILASFLGGGIFLVLADTLARSVAAPVQLPVGVVTAILGGTFFLFFFLGSKRKEIF